jgi:hypothetical protein
MADHRRPESADAVANEIMKTPVRRGSRTSISGAIYFAMPLFEENPYRGLRRVIDISEDGPNNNGAPRARPISSCSIVPKRPGESDAQPSYIARRVNIACDNSRTKNREAMEAYPLNRLFFQSHDPHIANPAFRGASHCREQRKLCATPGLTTAGKATDHANFEGL